MFDRIPKLAENLVKSVSRREFLGKLTRGASLLVGVVGTMFLFPGVALAGPCPIGSNCYSTGCNQGQCLFACTGAAPGDCNGSFWVCTDPVGGSCPDPNTTCGTSCTQNHLRCVCCC